MIEFIKSTACDSFQDIQKRYAKDLNIPTIDIPSFLSETTNVTTFINGSRSAGRFFSVDFSHSFPYSFQLYKQAPQGKFDYNIEERMIKELSRYR